MRLFTRREILLILDQRAIDIVQRAIDEDQKGNYAEAYKQYNNALDYFMLAIKCKSIEGFI
jgi:vacuolar protein-sorting-associated protein 4